MTFQLGEFTSASNPPSDIPSLPGRTVKGDLASNTNTTPFHPMVGPGMGFYIELTGPGQVVVDVESLCRDGSLAPIGVAADGNSASIMNRINYDGSKQNGIRIPVDSYQPMSSVVLVPGVVTGVVHFAIVQSSVR